MADQGAEQWIAEHYLVLALLGRGGAGSVYRVRDRRDGRELALKRLSAQAGYDRVQSELFEREFLTLSDLAHPRIIEVYDYGVDADGAYYTMELLGGQDLRALGKVPARRACELLRDVASSLAMLHSRRLIHCDVSARNVRCTLDGRAKLIDFGAMMPMGVAKRIVGTPPYLAPEVLNQQALDGRTDLYSLGALAYGLITGRTPYPAHSVSQLPELWRTRVAPPHRLDREIPRALSELVMELLQLDRNARPHSAAAVMQRLCRIAELPLEETPDVASSYLTTPTLIGRERQLEQVREALSQTLAGYGSVIAIAAPSGAGRSRFLDACVLEAKLFATQVVRLDRGDAGQGPFAAGAVLARELFNLSPARAEAAAHREASILASVLGAELVGSPARSVPPERAEIAAALGDFLLNAARGLYLVVAIDDADRIDEASASVLANLARKTRGRRSLSLVLTLESDGDSPLVLDLLDAATLRIELAPLSEAQTEQLLSSVFGDAKHLVTLAGRVHGLARGAPRAIMQLAAHLVHERIARYEAGSFSLPERLEESDLPLSLRAALTSRVVTLAEDALELGRALSLSEPLELSTASYPELTHHGDRARTFRAVDDLVRMQILERQGERYRLTDPAWSAAFSEGMFPDARAAIHARLARVFEQTGTIARRTHHLLESDQAEGAIRLLLAEYIRDPNEPQDVMADYVPGFLDQLERMDRAADGLALGAPLRTELRMKICAASYFLADPPRFLRNAEPLLAQLVQASGLAEYRALDPSIPDSQRLQQALGSVLQRYDASPEAERGLPPSDAIRQLTRLCSMYSGVASMLQDAKLLERVPTLEPFVAMSPAVDAAQRMMEIMRALVQGREVQAIRLVKALLARLDAPDGAGLGQLYNKSFRLAALYILGLSEAGAGVASAGQHVAPLEREPGYRINAQRVHLVTQLMQGDVDAAAASERRVELMMLHDGEQQRYPGTTLRSELLAHWLSDDLAGVKQVGERIASLVHRFPRMAVLLGIAKALHRHMQGDHAGALGAVEPVAQATRALEHRDWAWLVATHVQVLVAAKQVDRAIELGFAHLAACREHELVASYVVRALVEALLAAGRAQEAAQLSAEALTDARASGVSGLPLGAWYELRARAALALQDREGFHMYCDRCAAEYQPQRNVTLTARYQRLLRTARRDVSAPPLEGRPSVQTAVGGTRGAEATVAVRLRSCVNARERASAALTILLESAGATEGFLYGVRAGRIELLCSAPEVADDEALRAAMQQRFRSPGPPAKVLDLPGGSALWSVFLISHGDSEPVIAALAAVKIHAPAFPPLPAATLAVVADALLEYDDVDHTTWVQ